MRVPKEVVAELLLELLKNEPTPETERGRAHRRAYRVGICKALNICGFEVPEIEDAILRETSHDMRKRLS